MNPGYDTEGWEAPYRYSDMNQAVSPGNLQKRPIPFLLRKESRFGDVVQTQDKIISKEEWQKFLNGEQSILIPPNAKVSVEISAGVERTAYLHLALEQGAKAQISILQSEGYVLGGERGDLKVPVKGNREDTKQDFLQDLQTTIYVPDSEQKKVRKFMNHSGFGHFVLYGLK